MVTGRPPGARGIDEILAAARGRLRRVTPQEAFTERAGGAVLVDIRPAAQRADQGEIPGSVIVERNHLEWRFDPGCDARLPWVAGYDHRIIVFCMDGYTSSLAAASLHDLGLHRATDLIGGFRAWSAAGLPTAVASAGTVTLAPGAAPALPKGATRGPFVSRSAPGRSPRGETGRSRPGRSGWRRPLPAWACGRRATTAR
jgi:rhodanese-related sulfurtransferase